MKQVKIKLYHFDELSDDAKHEVCERERNEHYGFGNLALQDDADERMETLKKFGELFGLKWKIDYDHQYRFITWSFEDYDIDDENICGKYLWRFLNKFYFRIHTRKEYWAPFKYDDKGRVISPTPRRISKIMWQERNCPFTGMCYDEDILDEIWKWLKNPDWKISLHDLIDNCFHAYLKSWEAEDDYRLSDEGLSEMIELNWEDKLFFEDGREFEGVFDEEDDEEVA